MVQKPDVHLAVLIDGENISAKLADELFEKIATLGRTGVRRVYGDCVNGKLKPWAGAVDQHGILPIHVPTNGKNSADIAMAIDAMDLLHSGRYDGFCLVSSDRDFIRLAERIRGQACIAYGFGEKKSPKSLVGAFSKFLVIGKVSAAKPAARAQVTKAIGRMVAEKSPVPAKTSNSLTASRNQIVQLIVAKTFKAASDGCLASDIAAPLHQPKSTPVPPVQKTGQTGTVFYPHKALPWILEIWPANKEWMTLKALEEALTAKQPNYLSETNYPTTKKLFKALKDKFEPGLAADGKTEQVRRRP